MLKRSVGIDFGTTNSAIAVARSNGDVRVAKFPFIETAVETFRSVLFFEGSKRGSPAPGLWLGRCNRAIS